jgi:uncharacterized protein
MIDRPGLFRTAAAVYAALTAGALVLAWLTDVDLAPLLAVDLWSVGLGVAAVVPMSVVFFIAPDLKDQVVDLLGPALAECRLLELLLLAAMAGVSEELLFRGALEGWLRGYHVSLAVVVTNLLFGAMHPMSVVYFLFAAVLGAYLSWLATLGPQRNLTAPIVAHTVYDFVGFLLVARDYKNTRRPVDVAAEPVDAVETGQE